MFNFLSADGTQITMWVILGVFLVLMVVMTIIPQRKQKKKMQEMMSSLSAGDKIMTIGGFIGTIVEVDSSASDRFVVNLGTEEQAVLVTLVKNAIRSKL